MTDFARTISKDEDDFIRVPWMPDEFIFLLQPFSKYFIVFFKKFIGFWWQKPFTRMRSVCYFST
jgi:hypothetical protein